MTHIGEAEKVYLGSQLAAKVYLGSTQVFPMFKPKDLGADLLGWFDASDSASVVTVGGKVSQWTNKGVSSMTLAQATDANRPTYASKTVSIAATQILNAANSPAAYDFAMVGKPLGSADWRSLLRGTDAGLIPILIESATFRIGSYSTTFLPAGALTWGVASGIFYGRFNDAVATSMSRDGSVMTSTGAVLGTGKAAVTLVGAYSGPPPSQAWGDINEMIFLTYNTSDTIRQKVEGYLAHKWVLSSLLPVGHPYKSAPPLG